MMGLEKVIIKLTPLLLAGSLSLSNCGKEEKNNSGSCQDDFDCPGEEYCANGYCQSNSNGSRDDGKVNPEDTPNSSYPQTPQALVDDFLGTLDEGDIEGAVNTYIDAAVQKKYLNIFNKKSSDDMQHMIDQIKGATLIPEEEGTQLREYNILLSDGIEYPVQMMQVNENGEKIWKIRGI